VRIKLCAVAALVAIATLLPAGPSGAAARGEEHCAARVVGQKASGEFIMSPTVCRSTREAALVAVGARTATGYQTQGSFTIGVHYDGFSLSGDSFSVVGDNCLGGWLNLSSSWDNRVSSTLNGCYRIIHYDGDSLSGSAESTFGGGGNLIGLNNKANSIQYSS